MTVGRPFLEIVDLFAGNGWLPRALSALGHECVFASETDEELRELYAKNFRSMRGAIHGDIRKANLRYPGTRFFVPGSPVSRFLSPGTEGRKYRTREPLFHEISSKSSRNINQPMSFLKMSGTLSGGTTNGRTWKDCSREA